MNLTEAEIFDITCNRRLAPGLLKDSQINAAYQNWIVSWFDEDFLELVEGDPSTYQTLVDDYIKPVWAWGSIYNNFEYISTSITDKGIIQQLMEGTAIMIGRDSRMDIKLEIKSTIYFLLRRLNRYAIAQKNGGSNDFEKWKGLLLTPEIVTFKGRTKFNKIPY